jgi:hypothetical protein
LWRVDRPARVGLNRSIRCDGHRRQVPTTPAGVAEIEGLSVETPLPYRPALRVARKDDVTRLEHVPDGLGELAGHLNAGDHRTALATEPLLRALIVRGIDRVLGRMDGRFDQGPAQTFGSVLGQGSPIVLVP